MVTREKLLALREKIINNMSTETIQIINGSLLVLEEVEKMLLENE